MDRQALQISRIIDASSRALANWALTRMEEIAPTLPARYGPVWREHWLDEVVARLRYLSQAIAVQRPRVFSETVRWSRRAFEARQAEANDLRASLESLREVLSAELPTNAARIAVPYVQAALDTFDDGLRQEREVREDELSGHPLALKYLEPLLDGRQADAEAFVLSAVEDGLSVTEAYEKILQPAQKALGVMWHAGEISVADEHAGTAVTASVMAQLRRSFPTTVPNGKRLVAATAPGDLHDVGIRMICDYFQMAGWETHCLGANVPINDVMQTLRHRRADLVAIGASSLLHVRAVGELIDAIRADAATAKVRVMVGGPPFNAVDDLWQAVGADGYAATAREAVEVARSLVFAP